MGNSAAKMLLEQRDQAKSELEALKTQQKAERKEAQAERKEAQAMKAQQAELEARITTLESELHQRPEDLMKQLHEVQQQVDQAKEKRLVVQNQVKLLDKERKRLEKELEQFQTMLDQVFDRRVVDASGEHMTQTQLLLNMASKASTIEELAAQLTPELGAHVQPAEHNLIFKCTLCDTKWSKQSYNYGYGCHDGNLAEKRLHFQTCAYVIKLWDERIIQAVDYRKLFIKYVKAKVIEQEQSTPKMADEEKTLPPPPLYEEASGYTSDTSTLKSPTAPATSIPTALAESHNVPTVS